MRMIVVAILASLPIACGAMCAFAQDIDLEALAKRPGFTITKKVVKGEEIVEIRKASVVIQKTRDGMLGTDDDTAVMCMWEIYVDLKLASDFCFPDSERELKEDMADAVEHLKDFIVANNLTPVTRAQLDTIVQNRWKDKFAKMPSSLAGTQRCPMRDWLEDFKADGREKRRADVAKALAVSRPPVMNPCL